MSHSAAISQRSQSRASCLNDRQMENTERSTFCCSFLCGCVYIYTYIYYFYTHAHSKYIMMPNTLLLLYLYIFTVVPDSGLNSQWLEVLILARLGSYNETVELEFEGTLIVWVSEVALASEQAVLNFRLRCPECNLAVASASVPR